MTKKTHLIINISQAEDGFLFDLTQDGEEGGFHTVTVQSMLPSLKLQIFIYYHFEHATREIRNYTLLIWHVSNFAYCE